MSFLPSKVNKCDKETQISETINYHPLNQTTEKYHVVHSFCHGMLNTSLTSLVKRPESDASDLSPMPGDMQAC